MKTLDQHIDELGKRLYNDIGNYMLSDFDKQDADIIAEWIIKRYIPPLETEEHRDIAAGYEYYIWRKLRVTMAGKAWEAKIKISDEIRERSPAAVETYKRRVKMELGRVLIERIEAGFDSAKVEE